MEYFVFDAARISWVSYYYFLKFTDSTNTFNFCLYSLDTFKSFILYFEDLEFNIY